MTHTPSMAALDLDDLEQVSGGVKKFSMENDTRPVKCEKCGDHFQAPFNAKSAKCPSCGHLNMLQVKC